MKSQASNGSSSLKNDKSREKIKPAKMNCIFNIPNINLAGTTAIIPVVSVANVPQLTVDLIINNAPFTKIGTFWHEAFIPFISSDPFDNTNCELCTTCEVYFCEEMKLLVFQMRSPLHGKKQIKDCLSNLCQWLNKQNVSKVIVMTSVYSHIRNDEEIRDLSLFGEFRYIASPLFKPQEIEKIKNCEWRDYLVGARSNYLTESDNLGLKGVGAGFSVNLYQECLAEGLPCLVVLKFTSDGYNIPDAEKYLQFLKKYVNIGPSNSPIVHPFSWKFLREEGSPPPELY